MERYLDGRRGTFSRRATRLLVDLDARSFRVHRYFIPSLLVVVEHLLQAVQVETVSNILLVYLAEVLVVLQVAEPADPSVALL